MPDRRDVEGQPIFRFFVTWARCRQHQVIGNTLVALCPRSGRSSLGIGSAHQCDPISLFATAAA
jgi:hypothetical protein